MTMKHKPFCLLKFVQLCDLLIRDRIRIEKQSLIYALKVTNLILNEINVRFVVLE